jgi:hypothetical protein
MRRHFVNKQSSRSMASYLNCYKSHRTGCVLRDHRQIGSVYRINLWTAPLSVIIRNTTTFCRLPNL